MGKAFLIFGYLEIVNASQVLKMQRYRLSGRRNTKVLCSLLFVFGFLTAGSCYKVMFSAFRGKGSIAQLEKLGI